MGIDPLALADPFVMAMALEVSFMIGLFLLRCPLELAVLMLVPFNLILISIYVPAIAPVLAIVSGILIGLMFLKIVRR